MAPTASAQPTSAAGCRRCCSVSPRTPSRAPERRPPQRCGMRVPPGGRSSRPGSGAGPGFGSAPTSSALQAAAEPSPSSPPPAPPVWLRASSSTLRCGDEGAAALVADVGLRRDDDVHPHPLSNLLRRQRAHRRRSRRSRPGCRPCASWGVIALGGVWGSSSWESSRYEPGRQAARRAHARPRRSTEASASRRERSSSGTRRTSDPAPETWSIDHRARREVARRDEALGAAPRTWAATLVP